MRQRPAAWAAVALLVAWALTGCGKVTADIVVHEQGAYDMTLILAASTSELASAGQTADSFTALLTDTFAAQPGTEAFAVSDYQRDGYAGIEITGDDVPGDDVAMFGRGVVSTDGDGLRFDLQYPVTAVTASFTPAQTAALETRTTVTFPGAVTAHNGTLVDETTVEWWGDGSTDVHYTASSDRTAPSGPAGSASQHPDDDAGWVTPVAIGTAGALIALVVWFVRRSRTNARLQQPGQGRRPDQARPPHEGPSR